MPETDLGDIQWHHLRMSSDVLLNYGLECLESTLQQGEIGEWFIEFKKIDNRGKLESHNKLYGLCQQPPCELRLSEGYVLQNTH